MQNQSQCTKVSDEMLVRTYSNMIYKLAFSHVQNKSDADDIFQEVFLRYFKKTPQFENEEHKKAWLIRVTINCCKKHWSSWWYKKTIPLDAEISFTLPEENGLFEALENLSPKYRAVVHLFYYEGYPIEQISKILKTKQSTVRTQLTRARAQLRLIMKGEV